MDRERGACEMLRAKNTEKPVFLEQKVESLILAPGRNISGGGVGSLKASYTFLLLLPLRTHELSSLRRLETRIKPRRGERWLCCRGWADGGRDMSRHGVGHAGMKPGAPPWKASCALGLNLILVPPLP